MKKIIVSILICCCFLGVFSEESKSKVSEFKGVGASVKTYKFEGFNFENYKLSSTGLEEIIEDEYNFIKGDLDDKEKFAIVGHSQGGLRVLGFSHYIGEKDDALLGNLSAVITVSGVDRGLKALEGGLPAVNAKIKRNLQVINRGVIGYVAMIPFVDFIPMSIFEDTVYDELFSLGLDKLIDDKKMKAWLKPCLDANTEEKATKALENMGEIRDMIPESDFIKRNVMETKVSIKKVRIGTKRHLVWKKVKNRWGWKYWALRWVRTPVYGYKNKYEDILGLPEDIPIGYIVGLKNNSLDMLQSFIDKKDKVNINIRAKVKSFGDKMDIAHKVHITKVCFIYGLLMGSTKYARHCRQARDYCYNIDSNINKLLGSRENDGLVAKESQYIPKKFHQKYIGIDGNMYKTFDYNHKEIFYSGSDKEPPEDVKKMIEEMIEKGRVIRNN